MPKLSPEEIAERQAQQQLFEQEKAAAQQEAFNRTEWEHQRLESYKSLRYDFHPVNVQYWYDKIFLEEKQYYKPLKYPSWNEIRKAAGVGFLDNINPFKSAEKKKNIEEKRNKAEKELKEKVDEENEKRKKWCNEYNDKLKATLDSRYRRFLAYDMDEISGYFNYVLRQDSYSFDGNVFPIDFCLDYVDANKRLVVDYKFPTTIDISKIKEWSVNKFNEIIPKEMNKSDYLDLYERILFDLAMRVVGLLYYSDDKNVVNEIVFNGSCVYNNYQQKPTILLSFIIPKTQYSFERIKRIDFVSKSEIAKLEKVSYLDEITSSKPPAALGEEYPTKMVVPFESCL